MGARFDKASVSRWSLLVMAASLVAVGRPARGDRTAVPIDGQPFQARVLAIDQQGDVTFAAAGSRRVMPAADLVQWGAYRDTYRGTQLLLANGSLLMADVLGIDGEWLSAYGRLWGPLRLPLSQVQGVLFDPPAAAAQRDRLHQSILAAAGREDQLLLINGDVVAGVLTALREPPPANPSDPPSLVIVAGGRDVAVPLDRTAAVVFNPALRERPKPEGFRALLGFRDGSLLVAQRVCSKAPRVQIELPGAITVQAPAATIWDELVLLRPLTDRVTYLSDLQPIGYKHVPLLDISSPFHADRNVLGGRLRCLGYVYAKGLGMHGASRLAYDLAQPYRRFQAELAVDDRAGAAGSVVFRVLLPGESGGWQKVYQSPILRGGMRPLPVSVDIDGARRLVLIVDYAERGDVLDYANWLNARLIK